MADDLPSREARASAYLADKKLARECSRRRAVRGAALAGVSILAWPIVAQTTSQATEVSESAAAPPSISETALPATAGAMAVPAIAQSPSPVETQPINPTGRDIVLTVPVNDRDYQLGEIAITLTADQRVLIPTARFAEIVAPIVTSSIQSRLADLAASRETVEPSDLVAIGLDVKYDPAMLRLSVVLQTGERGSQTISLMNRNPVNVGEGRSPAPFSAYLAYDIRADYIHESQSAELGARSPAANLFGAINFYGIALETDVRYAVLDGQPNWQRFASRAVYDVRDWEVRLVGGDLRPLGRGFQANEDILGGGIERIYSDINPTRLVRSSGYQSIALDGPSEVEVIVNGSTLNRLNLDAGNYDLRDFPLAFGGNDVQLVVTDAAGRREVYDFNAYVADFLLEQGVVEFAAYGGIEAPFLNGEREYLQDRWFTTGFVRYGIFDWLTIGADGQANPDGEMFGANATFGTDLGVFSVEGAYSNLDAFGDGYAARFAYEASFGGETDLGYLRLEGVYRTEFFGPIGVDDIDNRNEWSLTASTGAQVNDDISVSFGFGYDKGRGTNRDLTAVSARINWSIDDDMSASLGGRYQNDGLENDYSVRVSFSARIGEETYVSANYDSRQDDIRLAVDTRYLSGADSYDLYAEIQRGPSGLSGSGGVNYRGNRIEAGLQHVTSYNLDLSEVSESRTSVQASGSVAFADGKFAIGRRIQNSFAIVDTHETLGDADVYVDYDDEGGSYTAGSDALGAALVPDLSANLDRSLRVSVPDAPVGYDLGSGNISLSPSYRSGFGITIGSDYTVVATGVVNGRDGLPIGLVSGEARLEGDPDAPVIQIFTNASGRFAASGLKPGRWIVTLNSTPPARFVLDVPDETVGLLQVGTVVAQQ